MATAAAIDAFGTKKYIEAELRTGHRPYSFANFPAQAADQIDHYERCQAIWASEAENMPGTGETSWWQSIPGVKTFMKRYDDPAPAHAFFLRSPAATREAWRWTTDLTKLTSKKFRTGT